MRFLQALPSPTWRWWPWVMGFASMLLLIPVLSWTFAHDQSVFATIADTMLHGGVLYRDAWEHKGPGVFVTYYLAFLLLGHDLYAVHAVEILGIGLGSAGLMRLGQRRLGSFLAGFVPALALPLIYLGWRDSTAQPESFAIPFVIWGFALWPSPEERDRVVPRCFASGMLLAAAVLFKTPMIFAPAILVLDRLVIDARLPKWTDKLFLSGVTTLGVAILPVLGAGYYAARGAWPELLDANLYFPAKYAAPSLGGKLLGLDWAMFHWVSWLAPLPGVALLVLGVARGSLLRWGETLRWGLAFLAGWAGVIIQAKYWAYHHMLMIPYLAAGFGLAFLNGPAPSAETPTWKARVLRGLHLVACALAGLTLVLLGYDHRGEWESAGVIVSRRVPDGVPSASQMTGSEEDIARVVRSLTGPNDRIFVFGDRAQIYVRSDRRLAGRYPHLLPVLSWFLGSEGRTRLAALIDRLGETPPRLVIITTESFWWYGGHRPREVLAEYPDMVQFLTDGYDLATKVGEVEIWRRRD